MKEIIKYGHLIHLGMTIGKKDFYKFKYYRQDSFDEDCVRAQDAGFKVSFLKGEDTWGRTTIDLIMEKECQPELKPV